MAELGYRKTVHITPASPYNFNANFHKPSHFPSSDSTWQQDKHWITTLWEGWTLGLKFENEGTVDKPEIMLGIYSAEKLPEDFYTGLVPEIRWRFNFDSNISGFHLKYGNDEVLGPFIEKWKGMKPIAANSLYETLVIYIVLQNATVGRTVQMLEALLQRFGEKVKYDGQTLSTFWEPAQMAGSSEQELRDLKLGYRAKFLMKISEQFVNGEIDEFALRKMGREEIKKAMLGLYGIGPASVEYLLFDDFYFNSGLETVPPWEQKILSKLIFNEELVPTDRIIGFFHKFQGWEKLAFHYVWEDVFWRRKHEHIEWLEKEIRL